MGNLARVLRALIERRLSTLTIFVTDRCNARCSFCCNWNVVMNPSRGDLLSADEWDRIAASAGRLNSLIVSGGEPFLRRELPDIVSSFVRQCGVRHVSIPTNAMVSTVPDTVREMVRRHPDLVLRVLFSIDGVGEDHERLRGVPGGFDVIEANVARMREVARVHPNVTLNAITIFHAGNRDRFRAVADWVDARGFRDHKVQMIRGDYPDRSLDLRDPGGFREAVATSVALARRRRGRGAGGLYGTIFSALNSYSRKLVARRVERRRPIIPCQAGRRLAVVRQNGDVFPCELLSRPLGNLREAGYDLQRILRGDEHRDACRWIRDTGCWCVLECQATIDAVFSPQAWPGVAVEVVRELAAGRNPAGGPPHVGGC